MIDLMEAETVMADLRRGGIQRITDDIFLLKTIILTNKRLVLVNRRLGSFYKQYVFLKDIQGLASERSFAWGAIVAGMCFILLAIGTIAMAGKKVDGLTALFAAVEIGVGIFLFLKASTNVIRISTTTEDIIFGLEKSFETDKADGFVNTVMREVARYKKE